MIILVLTKFYEPGYKAGGPIRSIVNLINHLHTDYEFKVLTGDRDSQEFESYKDIQLNEWKIEETSKVFYASAKKQKLIPFLNLLRHTAYDVLYINSFFSYKFSIVPMLLTAFKLIKSEKIIIAPRGEFSQSALSLKPRKKKIYIFVFKLLKLAEKVLWQASSQYEKEDIERIFPSANIHIAIDLPSKNNRPYFPRLKEKNTLKVIFLSRISPMKNLDYLLKTLSGLDGEILLDIYGEINDEGYWKSCKKIINSLSKNVKVEYKGVVSHDNVNEVIEKYHLLFLPSRGENYGHVIFESLSSGSPVLISDKTPWRDLQSKKIGWDLSLQNPLEFTKTLQKMINMEQEEFNELSKKAFQYSSIYFSNKEDLSANRNLFINQKALKEKQ